LCNKSETTLGDQAILNPTGKIDFGLSILPFAETNRKRLLGSQRRKKLDPRYGGKARIFAPLTQCRQNFIQNHYGRHNRRIRKMAGQAGMMSGNDLAYFKVHLADVSLIKHIRQLPSSAIFDLSA